MSDFPTLTREPSVSGWSEEVALDPTLKSPLEAGYVQTRPKFTRIPRQWHIVYTKITDSDKEDLEDFEVTVKVGSDSFGWTNPKTSDSHTVRFKGPIKYRMVHPNQWSAEFDLEEV